MSDLSSDYTTFVCPFGKFKYCRMSFGLKNAPAIFQEVVEQVLVPVESVCKNYIDDVVVFSACWEDHLRDLTNVITCLGDAGFKLKAKKCAFDRKHLIYLGRHKVGGGVVSVPELRIKAMSEFQLPSTKNSLDLSWGACHIIVSLTRDFPGSQPFSRRLSPSRLLSGWYGRRR